MLWKLGIRILIYLDDMLLVARTQEEARCHLSTIVELLIALGFIINLRKCCGSITEPPVPGVRGRYGSNVPVITQAEAQGQILGQESLSLMTTHKSIGYDGGKPIPWQCI